MHDPQTIDAPPRHWRRRLRDLAHVAERAAEQVRLDTVSGLGACSMGGSAREVFRFLRDEMLRLTRETE